MFVRKKKNRSGTTNVVVVDKHGGKFKELFTIGIGHSDEEIDALCIKGRAWIKNFNVVICSRHRFRGLHRHFSLHWDSPST